MIGKIHKGKGFRGAVAYVMEKDQGRLLGSNLVADRSDPQALAREMAEHAAAERPNLKNPVLHVSLSAAPGERLTDEQWRTVAEAYRERMGLSDTHYVLVRHSDTDHDHVHLVMSRVTFEGKTVSDSNDFSRQERALDEIEHEHGLTRIREQTRAQLRGNPAQAIENLLDQRTHVTEWQIRRYVARSIFDPEERDALVSRILKDRNTVYLGRDDKGRDLYSTRPVVDELQSLRTDLSALQRTRTGTLYIERIVVQPLFRERPNLSAQQQTAVSAITAGRGLSVVTGYAGAGKSTMLDEARAVWQGQGKDVIGAAVSGKAAKGLQESAGIDSNTISSTLLRLDRGTLKLSERSVLVIDEAGMVDNKQLAQLAAHVRAADAQLVLVGDSRQLRPVGRGGAFDMAREIAGETAIETVRRQRTDWQRDASVAFGQGRAEEAVQAYIDHDHVNWAASRGSARSALVRDYAAATARGHNTASMLVLAHRRDDVKQLNSDIRAAIKAQGKLGVERVYTVVAHAGNRIPAGGDYQVQELKLAVGDRIVCTRNDRATGVKNGEFGTILEADAAGIRVKFDDHREQSINLWQYGDIELGYASTVHKSQGATVERTFVLGTAGMDANLAYVALSRHREGTRLYAGRSDFENAVSLRETLSRRPEPDGLDLEDTELAHRRLSHDDQRQTLGRLTSRIAAAESRAEAYIWRSGTEIVRRHDAVSVLSGVDMAARRERLDGSVHRFSSRNYTSGSDTRMRGVQPGTHRGGESVKLPHQRHEEKELVRESIERSAHSPQRHHSGRGR